ncbi:hypothetical protein AQ914_04600 [Burkholderia pseudomallei]|nr:hypothetical protein AQ914_04600 [Burkholderia pseudomallei]
MLKDGTTPSNIGDALSDIDKRSGTNASTISQFEQSASTSLVQQATDGTINFGSTAGGSAVAFSNSDGAARTLTHVANGAINATSTDAVNVAQLYDTAIAAAKALGGDAYDAATGDLAAPTYRLSDGTYHDVGSALADIGSNVADNASALGFLARHIDTGAVGLVQQGSSGTITFGQSIGGSSVDFAGTNGDRVLSGVASGTAGDDVATVAQLKTLTAPTANAVTYDDLSLSTVTLGGTNGTLIKNVQDGAIADSSMQAINGGQLFSAQQTMQQQLDPINQQVMALEGQGSGSGSTVSGSNATASGNASTAIGENSVASGDDSSAVGYGAAASGQSGSAFGASAVASTSNSTAVGTSASTTGADATAIGAHAGATGSDSVAVGEGSQADRDNTVSIGSAGNERQLANVAAATQATDAINVGQLDDAISNVNSSVDQMRDDAFAADAAAMAAAGLPQPTAPGKSMVSLAGSTYEGEEGVAIGFSHASQNDRWVVKVAGTTDSRGEVGITAGASYHW